MIMVIINNPYTTTYSFKICDGYISKGFDQRYPLLCANMVLYLYLKYPWMIFNVSPPKRYKLLCFTGWYHILNIQGAGFNYSLKRHTKMHTRSASWNKMPMSHALWSLCFFKYTFTYISLSLSLFIYSILHSQMAQSFSGDNKMIK